MGACLWSSGGRRTRGEGLHSLRGRGDKHSSQSCMGSCKWSKAVQKKSSGSHQAQARLLTSPPLYFHTTGRKAAWRTKGETTKGPRHGKRNSAARERTASGKFFSERAGGMEGPEPGRMRRVRGSSCGGKHGHLPFFPTNTHLPLPIPLGAKLSGVEPSLPLPSIRGSKEAPCRRTTKIDASCSSSRGCLRPQDWSGRQCNQGRKA